MPRRSEAQYIKGANQTSRLTGTSRRKNTFVSLVCGFIAVMFLFVTVVSAVNVSSITAYADENQDTLNNAAEQYGAEGTGEGFLDTYEKSENERKTGIDRNSFGYVLQRLLSTSYINYTPLGVAEGGKSLPADGLNCDVNGQGAGTLVHHNCDVPTIATEFLQDGLSLFIPEGPQGAETENATIDNQWFGLPSNIPGNSAPVDPSQRSVKYTALELYGYNLEYTRYAGEWDHVKVMTSARSLSNFGFMDNLKLSVKTVINGVGAGMGQGLKNAADSLSEGDIFGAIGGAFSGFFGGGASASVNTILDTSDLNVINSNAWYRVGFGSTLYNARELTQEELAALAKSQFMDMLSSNQPDGAEIPADLAAIRNLPEDPKDAISSCSYKNASGEQSTYGNVSVSPGPTEADCKSMADAAYEERQALEDPPDGDSSSYTWKIDGTQKLETVADWKSNHSDVFDTAARYEMTCELDTNEANRKTALAALRGCWPEQHQAAESRELIKVQNNLNDQWAQGQVDPETLAKWFQGDSSRNFNAPWERFVCVDANGMDIREDNGSLVRAYNENGERNSKCGEIRSPIQNGLFGNGYITDPNEYGYSSSKASPKIDTRNEAVDPSIFSVIIPVDGILNSVANFGLAVAVLATRISNTVINLSFSPILETLGLTDKIVEIIKGLRDSLFFPIAVLVIAFSGLQMLIKSAKERNYGQQAVSILLMALTFFAGVMLMYRPELVIKAVDEVPAQIEQAIVGTIFSVGSNTDDEVCTASGTASAPKGTDLKGETLKYNPMTGTRSLMCENWRVFSFTPYIYGQWGTSFDQLYAENTSMPNKMQNTNTSLVGDASVNMGSGKVVKNWGLYQLDVLSSGTATDRDFNKQPGFVNNDFYRLVDMQAGPNNGAGTDSRYFENWSGNGSFERMIIGLLGAAVGLIGMITVIAFSITKIEITFVTTFMLLFLPMMLLMGLHPTLGRGKLKGYVGTILGLMVQRVAIVTLLAIMFKIIIGIGTASSSYLLVAFTTAAACILFLSYKKEIMGMIFQAVGDKFGQTFGSSFVDNPRGTIAQKIPTSARNYGQQLRRGAIGLAGGAVGGFVAGRGAIAGARESAEFQLQGLKNIQRRAGYGALQSASVAAKAGKDAALESARNDLDRKLIARDLSTETDAGFEARLAGNLQKTIKELEAEQAYEGENFGATPPGMEGLLTGHKAGTARDLARLVEIEKRINELKLNDKGEKKVEKRALDIIRQDDIDSIIEGQEIHRTRRQEFEADPVLEDEDTEARGRKTEMDRLLEKKGKYISQIQARETAEYNRSSQKEQMRDELKSLVQRADEAIDRAKGNE